MRGYGSHGYGRFPAYVPVAERRRKAEKQMANLRKTGHAVSPVAIEGRKIATTFWGKAWCDNLESYRDYENRLPRGRTYVRNGSVVDLQISARRVSAMVMGSQLYTVSIAIDQLPHTEWRAICADCASGIDSLIELLQGRLSEGVMARLCRQKDGLFPGPAKIHFSCTCPDSASMCKHVAAALYGVGARLDSKPELLFELRGVDAKDLVTDLGKTLPASRQASGKAKLLDNDDIAGIFGLDMAVEAKSPAASTKGGGAPLAVSAKSAKVNPVKAKGTAGASRVQADRQVPAKVATKPPAPTALVPKGAPSRTSTAKSSRRAPAAGATPAKPTEEARRQSGSARQAASAKTAKASPVTAKRVERANKMEVDRQAPAELAAKARVPIAPPARKNGPTTITAKTSLSAAAAGAKQVALVQPAEAARRKLLSGPRMPVDSNLPAAKKRNAR